MPQNQMSIECLSWLTKGPTTITGGTTPFRVMTPLSRPVTRSDHMDRPLPDRLPCPPDVTPASQPIATGKPNFCARMPAPVRWLPMAQSGRVPHFQIKKRTAQSSLGAPSIPPISVNGSPNTDPFIASVHRSSDRIGLPSPRPSYPKNAVPGVTAPFQPANLGVTADEQHQGQLQGWNETVTHPSSSFELAPPVAVPEAQLWAAPTNQPYWAATGGTSTTTSSYHPPRKRPWEEHDVDAESSKFRRFY